MPSPRINRQNKSGCYFTTCTVERWYYMFDRYDRWKILANSLKYCISHKNLQLYAFVFMLNHLHLLFSSPDVIGVLRDFKRFTSKELKTNIQQTEPNVLNLFLSDKGYQFWKPTNMPILIESQKIFKQKLLYIHYNPIKKQYVEKPEYWYWSSANPN